MILDSIKNCELYYGANSRFRKAFDFIKTAENKSAGRYELDGENLYAMVQEYDTKLAGEMRFESHKRYIDIQYILSGAELMKVADITRMTPNTPYDDVKDCTFFQDAADTSVLILQQNDYAIFFPQDIHMPGLAPNEIPAPVRKIVVKVKID